LLLVDQLLGLEGFVDQSTGPLEVLHRGDQSGFVLLLLGLRLIQGRLVEPRVDLGQHVALADLVAFLEKDLLELAVDLRADAHGERGLHGSEPGQIDWQVPL
jgi:hypothetical protein